LAKLVRQSICK